MAPVANRRTIDSTGSTSSIGTGWFLPSRNSNRPAQRAKPLVLVVDRARILLEDVVTARLRGVLEPKDGLGVEKVVFAVAPPLVLAPLQQPARQRFAARRTHDGDDRASRAAISARPMPPTRDAVLSKYFRTKSSLQPDRLENLGSAITLNRADAHLGHHLDDPLLDRLAESDRRPRRGRCR